MTGDLSEELLLRLQNFIRLYQGCQSHEADIFLSLDNLTEMISSNLGILVERCDLIEVLEELSFKSVQIEGERMFPVKVLS
jgi:hypothetical protein